MASLSRLQSAGNMHIREAQPEDASAVIALFEKLYTETKFLLFEPGEATVSEEQYAQRIEQSATTEIGVMFLAEVQRELIAACFGNRGVAKRNRHSLFLVMGVLHSYSGNGVGNALLHAVECWATSKQLHRLELTVDVTNQRAISLYEKFGFQREGTKRHSLKIGGQYVDEYYMSKLIAD